jgi:hypothetical protein
MHHAVQKGYSMSGETLTDTMSSRFIQARPLQALKLIAVVGILAFAFVSFVGVLPGQELTGLLVLAFFALVLAVVVAAEALLAGHQLAQADDPVARLTARRVYTAIRAIELVVTVVAPGIFYVLIVQKGGEVAGPGAIGLLFTGIVLSLLAYCSVVLRTLTECYYHPKRPHLSRTDKRSGNVAE